MIDGVDIEILKDKKRGGRYSVSRKGMGGRKTVLTKTWLLEHVVSKLENGYSLSKVAVELEKPYVSLRVALKRNGLPTTRVKKVEVEIPEPKVAETTEA